MSNARESRMVSVDSGIDTPVWLGVRCGVCVEVGCRPKRRTLTPLRRTHWSQGGKETDGGGE